MGSHGMGRRCGRCDVGLQKLGWNRHCGMEGSGERIKGDYVFSVV
jgi:hypothetical protein